MKVGKFSYANLLVAVFLFLDVGYSTELLATEPKISLKLTGGGQFIVIGDLNASFESWARTLPSRSYDTVSRAMKIDCWSTTWEAELRFDLSKKIAVGIALSNPLRRTKQAEFPLHDPSSDDPVPVGSFASDAAIDVRSPIKISACYTRPLSLKTNLLFHAGIGYYSGRMQEALDCEYFDDWHRSAWQTEWKSALGFHGGVSFEYVLSKRFSFVLDAQLRRAVLTDFPATMDLDSNMVPSGLFYFDESGTLYLARWDEEGPFGIGTQEFYVWTTEPVGPVGGMFGAMSRGPARLNLSGISLRVGIRIALF